MENGLKAALIVAALPSGIPEAWAQEAANPANPAARTHVRIVNGVALKHTSRLSQVVELNFTLGFTHTDGKKVNSQALDRIAETYAMGGKDAFAIRKFTTVAAQEAGRPSRWRRTRNGRGPLTDVTGRLVTRRSGRGKAAHAFDRSGLGAGVYFLGLKVGSWPAMVRRYAVAPSR